jgi:hypothetical protein
MNNLTGLDLNGVGPKLENPIDLNPQLKNPSNIEFASAIPESPASEFY